MSTHPTPPRPLLAGDKLELYGNSWSNSVQIVLKSDAKFAYLQNGTKVSQTPVDTQKGIYSQYCTQKERRECRWSSPSQYRLITPEYEAEKAAALAEKVEQIKAKLAEGITEKQALQILQILNPAPAK